MKTANDIPSLGNLGLKVAPRSTTNRYMELHKLDYKRTNLLKKLEKAELEMKNMKTVLALLEAEMGMLHPGVPSTHSSQNHEVETEKTVNSQVLKY